MLLQVIYLFIIFKKNYLGLFPRISFFSPQFLMGDVASLFSLLERKSARPGYIVSYKYGSQYTTRVQQIFFTLKLHHIYITFVFI